MRNKRRIDGQRRVLVVSASMGAGHDGAARELVRRLQQRGHEARMVDFLKSAPFALGPLTRWLYELQLRRAPWAYEAIYRLWYALPVLISPFIAGVNTLTGRRLRRWCRRVRADVVVSTYPLASVVLGRERAKGRLKVPVVTFITDFAVHPLWVHKAVDLHLCVHPQSSARAEAATGGPAKAPGPLTSACEWRRAISRSQARERFGFRQDERVVLVVAGSWGVGEVEETFDALLDDGRFTPVVVCGHNERLRDRLMERGAGHVLGWTDAMPDLMAAADVLVQNAGGLTCMEAFAVGLPVVTFRPIPGHGRENAEDMHRAGVAAYANDHQELHDVLDLATGPAGLAMAAAARRMFAGDAVDDVLELAGAAQMVHSHLPRARLWRQRAAAVVIALGMGYASFTVGVATAAAHGIGVAGAPRRTPAVYLAVRVGPDALENRDLVASLARTHATAVIEGGDAVHEPEAVRRLVEAGIDVANGGWGRRYGFRWERARVDVVRSGRAISEATGSRCHRFVPARSVDGFDLASARVAHQEVVVADHVLTPRAALPPLRAGEVYVLDAAPGDDAALLPALRLLEQQLARLQLVSEPLNQLR